MRFRHEATETILDAYPWGENVVAVCSGTSVAAVAGVRKSLELDPILPGPVWRAQDSQGNEIYFLQVDNRIFLHYKGYTYQFLREERTLEHSGWQPNEIRSPMPGKILKIYRQEGESFEKGESLILLEAMKMENQLKAPFSGTITRIYVEEGELVRQDAALVELEIRKKN